jgi:cytochrome b561
MFQNSVALASYKRRRPLLSRRDLLKGAKLRWINARDGSSLEHGLPHSKKAPAMSSHPTGYTRTQIVLHWVIAALVIFQIVFGEDIVPAFRAFRQGTEPQADALFSANLHVYVGLAVLVLATLRVALRIRYGAPPLPAEENIVLQYVAKLAHIVLYAAIFLMPITGALAWYLGIGEIGELHEFGKPVIIVVVAVHAAGALWQHFVARTDVLRRMLKPMA